MVLLDLIDLPRSFGGAPLAAHVRIEAASAYLRRMVAEERDVDMGAQARLHERGLKRVGERGARPSHDQPREYLRYTDAAQGSGDSGVGARGHRVPIWRVRAMEPALTTGSAALEEQGREHTTNLDQDAAPRPGFTLVPNQLLFARGLTHGAKLTYALLLGYAWQDGRCFPGQERLSDDLGVERKAVIRYLKELKDSGLVRIVRRGLGQSNLYILPKLADTPFLAPEPPSVPDVSQIGHQPVPLIRQPVVPMNGRYPHPANKTQKGRSSTRFDSAQTDAAPETKEPITMPVSKLRRSRQDAGSPGVSPHEAEPAVAAVLEPLRRTFRDAASNRATITRALHLLECSGLDVAVYIRLLQEAGARTRGSLQVGVIASNPMAYFFGCLAQLLDDAAASGKPPSPGKPPRVEPPIGKPSHREMTGCPDDDHPLWTQVREELAAIIAERSYREMVASTRVVADDGLVLRVATRTAFQRDWLTNRLGKRISDILSDLGHESLRIEFEAPETVT